MLEKLRMVREAGLTVLVILLIGLCLYGYIFLDQLRISYQSLAWINQVGQQFQTINTKIADINKQLEGQKDDKLDKETK